jgi:hypothetical protein
MTEAKALIALAVAVILIGGGWWLYHSAYSEGQTAGKAEIQSAWDLDKAAIQAAADKAVADATKARDDALEANGVIQNDYQAQLSAADARATVLAGRLRDYQARIAAGSSGVPKAGGGQGTTATSPESAQEAGIYERLASYDAACQSDAAQLNALIAELTPQL